jgi:hypothetical protein
MRRTPILVATAGALVLAGCVLGYRGLSVVSGSHDLTGIDEVRIDLPDTPLTVHACAAADPGCPVALAYEGRWESTGGSGKDAERNATTPRLRFSAEGAFAALQAVVPLSVVGEVDLAMDEIRLPDDRDLDLRTGVGDVEVVGVTASVVIDVEIGDVTVYGADDGLGVHTGRGRIVVETPGHADLESDRGAVEVTQTGSGRDLRVETGLGDILVRLASDADLELVIDTPDAIRVRTDAISSVTDGHFERRTGSGGVRVELVSRGGDIEVELAR